MSARRLVVCITFLAVFAMAARISMDTDTWWHLRAGQWMWENKSFLRSDLFSYTRYGAEWHYPGWLVEVPMYWIYTVLGPGGLNLFTAALVALTFSFVWRTLSGGVFTRAFVVVLAAAASGIYWAARPYLATFLLAAVFLWILEDYRRGRADRLWWLPALMIIWANSHGGFAVGFILWGIYLTDAFSRQLLQSIDAIKKSDGTSGSMRFNDRSRWISVIRAIFPLGAEVRRLLLAGLLMLPALALNPVGPRLVYYPFETVSIGALREYIQEWQSPNFHDLSVQPFLWLFLLTLGAVGFSRRRFDLSDYLLAGGFGALALMAGRNIALFAVVAPCVFTRHAAPLMRAWGRRLGVGNLDLGSAPTTPLQGRLNIALLILLVLAVGAKISLVFPQGVNWDHFNATLPVTAVETVRSRQPSGRLFNAYNWGGYLLWALPEYPVFIDGRTDLYNDEIIGEWLRVVRAEEGWQEVLRDWGVNLILLEPNMPVVARLPGEGWRMVYHDEIAVLYRR